MAATSDFSKSLPEGVACSKQNEEQATYKLRWLADTKRDELDELPNRTVRRLQAWPYLIVECRTRCSVAVWRSVDNIDIQA